jgi:hypothetical protein
VPLSSLSVNNPPAGFEVVSASDHRAEILYKQPTRGCAILFLVVFGVAWCAIGGTFIFMTLTASFAPMALFGSIVLGVGVVGLIFAGLSALKTYRFTLEPELLTIATEGPGGPATRTLARKDIARIFVRLQIVHSVSSTANGPVTSNSRVWSVVAYTPSAVKVLPSAGQAQCEWLGSLLGGWAECVVETDN